jgi:hypothetical protein
MQGVKHVDAYCAGGDILAEQVIEPVLVAAEVAA